MKKINALLLGIFILGTVNFVNAAVPKEEPLSTIGGDFLVIRYDYRPVLYTLFDSTNIYVDIENDGVWELQIVKNAGESFEVYILTQSITYGTRIHTDKPVICQQRFYSNTYNPIPPISSLRSSYYAYGGTWYAIAQENLSIYVDNNDDGTIDTTIDATPLKRNSIPVSNFAKVFANKPFYLYNEYVFAAQTGTDFYLPRSTVRKIIVTQNNTEVKVDKDNDGHYDGGTVTWNKGAITEFSGLTFTNGAHIRSDKPIAIYLYFYSNDDRYAYPIEPSDMLGNDMWSYNSGIGWQITGFFNNATGIASNTTYYIDRVIENDLIPNSVDTVNSNQVKELPNLGYIHTWANMPFIEYYDYSSYHYVLPYSSITATQYGTQKYLGANELTTIRIGIFNPFANTTIADVNVTASFPENFSIPIGDDITLNIEKRYLRNDIVIESSTVIVTPSLENGDYVFRISLNTLEPMRYYNIEYQIVTPSEVGSFHFNPVKLDYEAETWNMPQ